MDLVLANGAVVTPGGVLDCDVGIEDGKIAALGQRLTGAARLDASGRYVFPGMVDPHVHLLDLLHTGTVTERQADDFDLGTRAAAQGGVTLVVDFAYQRPGKTLRHALDRAATEVEGRSWVDYSFHCWVTDPSEAVLAELPGLLSSGFSSFKVFMDSDAFNARVPEYLHLMEQVGRVGGLVVLHCEDRDFIDFCMRRQELKGDTSVEHYFESKPPSVEVAATSRGVEMCRLTGAPIYIVHLSCERALDIVRSARHDGLPVFVETRPLYLHLTEEKYNEPEGFGVKYVGTPPLRKERDRSALWAGLGAGDIDVIATDHVGWYLEQKLRHRDTPHVMSGVPALATNLALMYSEGVLKDRITVLRLVDLLSANPARILGIYPRKGAIAVGSDADLVVFDPSRRVTITGANLQGASDFDPYEGFEVIGWPETTVVRGIVVFDRGELAGGKPSGALVPRSSIRSLVEES